MNHLPGGEIASGSPGSPERLRAEARDKVRLQQKLLKHYLVEHRRELRINARMVTACMVKAVRRGAVDPKGWEILDSTSIEARRALVYLGRAIAAATDLDRIRERIADGEEN